MKIVWDGGLKVNFGRQVIDIWQFGLAKVDGIFASVLSQQDKYCLCCQNKVKANGDRVSSRVIMQIPGWLQDLMNHLSQQEP